LSETPRTYIAYTKVHGIVIFYRSAIKYTSENDNVSLLGRRWRVTNNGVA